MRTATSRKTTIASGRYPRMVLPPAVSLLLVLIFALSCPQVALAAPLSNADASTWTTDGYVNTIMCRGDTTYIGGSFTGIGPPLKGGAALDALTGDIDLRPGFDAAVKAAVSDGSGGWYVGGDFTQVLGVVRNRLAHIRGDGTLDPDWDPGATGSVNALLLSADGNALFVGGAFSGAGSIGGTDRNYLAKLDAHGTGTGDPTWNPNPWDQVLCMALSPDGSSLYIGGRFLRVGIGWVRNRIAKVETGGTGAHDATWNPNANHWVDTMCLSADGNSLFVGGVFSDASGTPTIGGQTRNYIAKLDAHNAGAADPNWDPNARPFGQAYVYSVSLTSDGNYLFASGQFQTIGGQSRFGVAKLEAGNTGQADATWNTGCNGFPRALAVSPDRASLFVGGDYSQIGGQQRKRLAKVSTSGTGTAEAWSPSADAEVGMIAPSSDDGSVFVGGQFTSIRVGRSNLAAIDNVTGEATAWQPNPNGEVSALAFTADGNSIYVGGDFNGTGSVGGLDRKRLAKVSTSGAGSVDASWDPSANAWVRTLTLSADGSSLFAGGDFTTIGAQSRNYIAKLDAGGTGAADASWNPNANGGIYSSVLSADGNSLFVGGWFGTWNGSPTIGGLDRNCIAKLDAGGTGAADASWDPSANSTVYSMALSSDGNALFVGGEFATWNGTPSIGGQDRNCIAKLDAGGTGAADANWDPSANFFVQCVRVSPDGGSVIAAGDFCTDQGSRTIGGQDLNYLARLDATGTGQADPTWNANPHSSSWPLASGKAAAFSPQGNSLFAGGTFSDIGGLNTSFARFCYAPTATSVTPSQAPNDAPVNITDITGTGFRSTSAVLLRRTGQPDISATGVNVTSSEHLFCTFDITGASGGQWDLVVVNPDTQQGVLAGGFLVRTPTPTLDTIAPNSGIRGTTVIVNDLAGTNFDGTPVVELRKNGQSDIQATNVACSSPTSLQCDLIMPLDAATGTWDVTLTNPDGQEATLPGGFTINNPAPTLASISPGSGKQGSTVSIDDLVGTGFYGTPVVKLKKNGQSDITATDVACSSPSSLQCKFLLPVDAAAGPWDVVLTNPDDQSAILPSAFEVLVSAPVVTGVSPSTVKPGDKLTITGVGFGAGPGGENYVTIGGVRAKEYISWADTRIEVIVPDGAASGAVQVFTAQGGSNTDKRVTIIYPEWYVAEGTTAWGFSTYITLENPNDTSVTAKLTYMDPNPVSGAGKIAERTVTLPPLSQTTVDPRWDLGNVDFSTKVECASGKTIAVDRTMFWSGADPSIRGYHSSIGTPTPSKTWYLPEGSSAWGFETWTAVLNPNPDAANITLSYMTEAGPITKTKAIPPNSRATYNMASDIGVADASIQVTSDQPVVAERSMYRDNRREGSCSIGATTPDTDFFLSEGAVGYKAGFTTYILIQNPCNTDNTVSLTYQTGAGKVTGPTFTMGPNSRKTMRVNDTLPPNTDVSTQVHGTKPLIAERAMYWDSGIAFHASIGLPDAHMTFMLPDGQADSNAQTWTLVANPNPGAVTVRISYFPQNGGKTVSFTSEIPRESRATFKMADKISGRASILVQSLDRARPVMVERSMYGQDWGSGTCTIGGFSD